MHKRYIYISYAVKDRSEVRRLVEELTSMGYDVLFDVVIEFGSEWENKIADQLRDSGCVLLFLTENSLSSHTVSQELDLAISEGKDIILDIEIQGAKNVKKIMPEAALVYLLPPSIGELERRLVGRNTEDAETVAGRLHTARIELNEAPELYDYFIVNDLVDNAAIKIKDIIEGERCSKNSMQEVLKQILEEAENLA